MKRTESGRARVNGRGKEDGTFKGEEIRKTRGPQIYRCVLHMYIFAVSPDSQAP